VNAPFSCPNSSLSIRVGEMAPQSTTTTGLSWRALSSCTVCASSSLPVPLSPVISTVASVRATLRAVASSDSITPER
jgi:hypothetical protein